MPKRVAKITGFQFTESTVLDALESTYEDKSKGTFLRGVRDATGFNSRRTADGLYMGAWQSVGVQLHGFEVKVSRSDWTREIQDVSKAGQFEKYCHYWWVAAPEGCVKIEEMPAQWGLKIVSKTEEGYRVRAAKAATLNQSAALDYGFFSSCLRQCKRDDPNNVALRRAVDEAFHKGRLEGESRNHSEQQLKHIQQQVNKHIQKIAEFEKASGIRIEHWSHTAGQVGKAVEHVLRYGQGNITSLAQIVDYCQRVQEEARDLLEIEKRVAPLRGLEDYSI